MTSDTKIHPNWPPAYTLRHSKKAKHLRIEMHRKHGLLLVIPATHTESQALDFLNQHRQWVETKLKQTQPLSPTKQATLPSSISFPAVEQTWRLTYLPAKRTTIQVNSRQFELMVKTDLSRPEQTIKRLQQWFLEQAHRILADRLYDWSQRMGLEYKKVQIRRQQTRWGSCSSQQHISLNAKLLFLPEDCIDYVLIHELCHLVHMNHSRRFWQLVALYCPDYKSVTKKMRKIEHLIPEWAIF